MRSNKRLKDYLKQTKKTPYIIFIQEGFNKKKQGLVHNRWGAQFGQEVHVNNPTAPQNFEGFL